MRQCNTKQEEGEREREEKREMKMAEQTNEERQREGGVDV